MPHAHPWFSVPWDAKSDQPDRLRDRSVRRALRAAAMPDYAIAAATTLGYAPFIAAAYARLGRSRSSTAGSAFNPRVGAPGGQPRADHLGVAITPWPDLDQAQADLIAELGITQVSVRLPVPGPGRDVVSAGRDLAGTWACLAALPPSVEVHGVLCQDRRAICNPAGFANAVDQVLAELPDRVTSLQLGNATNRRKWGCNHLGEYHHLAERVVPCLRASGRLVVGGSVIDFEPLASIRAHLHRADYHLDAVASLLYVDRRGGPDSTQYGVFDFRRKLRTVAAILSCSPRNPRRLWLTEVNWPLAGHGPWAPTAPELAVDEAQAGAWLADYCDQSYASGLSERVYVWQLIARGYGLVDPDGLRRRPGFDAVKAFIDG